MNTLQFTAYALFALAMLGLIVTCVWLYFELRRASVDDAIREEMARTSKDRGDG